MIKKEKIKELLPFRGNGLILLGYRGSIAHGTFIPDHIDDKDIFGVVVPPVEYIFGIDKYEQTERKKDNIDLLVYEIRKYVRLLLNSNPNTLGLLWLKPEHYILRTELGNRLIDNRQIFISKQLYKTYGGYAFGQMQRITHCNYEGYMGEKRKKLVEKYGYDCKNAAHLIRLLRMGIEVLSTGEINVSRHDRKMLIDIKYGEWSLERVKKEADRLFVLLDEAYVHSKLPEKPDVNKAKKLCINILRDYYKYEKI